MYEWKLSKEETLKELKGRTKKEIANIVGITDVTFSYIINKKRIIRKLLAYCITKAFDNDKEIEYFFIRKEDI